MKSNSLTREAYYSKDDPSVVHIHNPLSQDLSRMRKKLLYGGLEAVQYNLNRKKTDLRLYEFGNCYKVDPEVSGDNPREKYIEKEHLGIFISGDSTPPNWITPREEASFYHLRSILELVFAKLGLNLEQQELKSTTDPDYSEALDVINKNEKIATFGKVHPSLLEKMEVKQDVYAAEVIWDAIIQLHAKSSIIVEELPRFPEVKRDLSLMLDREITFEQLYKIAFRTEKKLLKNLELFDVYEGENIEKGKKSYALSFTLQDKDKTLTDKQIDKVMNAIANGFEKHAGAVVRGG
jgi:phenylalanyl-tRNA synthetase beta chain